MKYLCFVYLIFLVTAVDGQNIVKKEKLIKKGDLTCLKDSEGPFTGIMATYHANGQPYSYTHFENGKRSGKIEIFFDSGNRRVLTFEDKDHKNYGKIMVWNEDGSPAFKGEWIDGRLYEQGSQSAFTGEILVKFKNGVLNEQTEFRDGQWNGKQLFRDREGNVISECYFKDNEIMDCTQL